MAANTANTSEAAFRSALRTNDFVLEILTWPGIHVQQAYAASSSSSAA